MVNSTAYGDSTQRAPQWSWVTLRRQLVMILVISLLLAVVLNVPFLALDLVRDIRRTGRLPFSQLEVFKKVQIGMSYPQVEKLLREEGVRCERVDYEPLNWPLGCVFTDFWREYQVRFDRSGVISQKSYSFRHAGRRY